MTDRADELFELIGLKDVKKHYPNELSGGEQQRCAIARAVITNPKIVIADEPTGNLDSKSSEKVYSLMRAIYEKLHTTFVIVTHAKTDYKQGDRIIEIKDGSIMSDRIFNGEENN